MSFRITATPGDHSPETIAALREGEDACGRLAVLWASLGYRIE